MFPVRDDMPKAGPSNGVRRQPGFHPDVEVEGLKRLVDTIRLVARPHEQRWTPDVAGHDDVLAEFRQRR